MKTICLITLIILSSNVNAQMVIGMGGAVSDKGNKYFQTQIGVTFGNQVYEDEEKRMKANCVYALLSVGYNSQIASLIYGRNIGSFQPFLGTSFHLTNIYSKNPIGTGFKPVYGLTYHLGNLPLSVSVMRSGKENLLSLKIYTVK